VTGTTGVGLTKIKKIAVFRALFLGDLICATPALRAVRGRFPDAEITLIGLPWAQFLVDRTDAFDRFEEFPGFPGLPEVLDDPVKRSAFIDRMRGERFDLAIQLHGDGRASNGFVAALEARHSLGFAPEADSRLSISLPWCEEEHEVHRWLRLVNAVGADSVELVSFPVTTEDEERIETFLSEQNWTRPLIGMHCGSKLPSRRWPADRFAQLGDSLIDRFGGTIVLTGAEHERPITSSVQRQLRAPALDMVGRTDLGALGALIGKLDLLVTNDTGVSHVAAAARTRSVVLFGPSNPQRWAPLDRGLHTVVDAAESDPDRSEKSLSTLPVSPVRSACDRALRLAGFAPYQADRAEAASTWVGQGGGL
jgi:ADP-heptose:LPS heptosyltransferase